MLSIKGVYAAAVTPRRLGMQDINLGVMWDVFDFLIERGVDGIVLLGSTGEFLHYSTAERMRMMGLAPKRSRVPVIINVSHSTLDGTVELAQAAAASGAAGVLVMPPYFFRYGAADVASFYEQFFQEAELSIPVLLYHIPVFTNPIPFEVAERLLRNGVASGVKDSSGDVDYARKLADLRAASAFVSMMGNDALFPDARRARSIDAVVSGIASAVPELLVALNRAIEKNAQEVVTRLETRLDQFIAWTDKLPVPVCIREAASARGLQLGPHAIPACGEQERVVSELREWFKPWLADVQRECKHA